MHEWENQNIYIYIYIYNSMSDIYLMYLRVESDHIYSMRQKKKKGPSFGARFY